uniref:substrate-binding domain-containing protein n=1 Tax=Streptomyces specialis TaxID=498367 RepID=UPI000B07F520
MATVTCGAAVLATAVLLTACLAACGDRHADGAGDDTLDIGVLFPDNLIPRWQNHDKPQIERGVRALCPECSVEVVNAQNDVATQQQQMDSMITRGVEVLVLDPLDPRALRSAVERADEAGIPVVSYDRLAEGPVSGYVSFDSEEVGRLLSLIHICRRRCRGFGNNSFHASPLPYRTSPNTPTPTPDVA